MPLKKGQTKAFPTAKKHFKLANGWQSDFNVMQSRANDGLYSGKKEFFDKPVEYHTGMNTNKTNTSKAMEVYHKITPVRSIQQSINLIRALKTEQKEEISKQRPKSVAYDVANFTESYGIIPNLRDSVDRQFFLPAKKHLKNFDNEYVQHTSPGRSPKRSAKKLMNNYMSLQNAGQIMNQNKAATATNWIPSQEQMGLTDGFAGTESGGLVVKSSKRRRRRRKFKSNAHATAPGGQIAMQDVQNLNAQSQGSLQSMPAADK